jgi:hypothetical protein
MAFVTPTDVTVGSVLTASKYNQEVVENTKTLARGIIARDTSTSNQSGTASMADITGLITSSVTLVQGRSYRITLTLFLNSGSNTVVDYRVVVGSTNLATRIAPLQTTTRSQHFTTVYTYDQTAATASVAIKAQMMNGAGTAQLNTAAGFSNHEIVVEDIGVTP